MYTRPDFARQGVGRMILKLCEAAAAAEGFRAVQLMATLSGEPLYRACGYQEIERVISETDIGAVPLILMSKSLPPAFAVD
jgi:GNAT superfamily N-acetyltransferase